MDGKILRQHFYNFKADLTHLRSKSGIPDELTEVVFCSEWLRISLTGNISTEQISIQVEVLNTGIPTPSNHHLNKSETKLNTALETHIRHLQYLLYLFDKGFSLDILLEEGIWFALKILPSEPSQQIMEELFQSKYQVLERSDLK
ncbi:MAG: hypothetical protein ACXABU_17300 [Candidatus Hodarchaeales archaeon]|jgi:hypothetical protein